MAIGLIAWFLMPDRPEACKWLTDEERGAPAPVPKWPRLGAHTDHANHRTALAEVRIKSENVGQSQAIDTLRKKAVLQGIFAPSTLGMSSLVLHSIFFLLRRSALLPLHWPGPSPVRPC